MKKSNLNVITLIGLIVMTSFSSCNPSEDETTPTPASQTNFLQSHVGQLNAVDLGVFTQPTFGKPFKFYKYDQ